MPYIGRDLNRGNYLKLDDISSSFNGSTKTFNLTVGGSAFTPGSAFSILVSVGGVIQEPESAYQVNNSEITFANAPTAQDGFFCTALAAPIGVGVPGNGTVNGAQIAKPFNYDGFFYLNDGTNRVGINSSSPTVALDVIGNIKLNGNLVTGSGGGGLQGNVYAASGISTFNDVRVTNNLTVEGTTTTLDTNLIGVDRIEVGANSNTVTGIAVTQSGTADIVRLYDGTSQVVTVDDVGNVGLGSATPSKKLDVVGDTLLQGQTTIAHTTSPQLIIKDSDTNSPGDLVGVSFRAANNTEYGFIGSPDAGGHTLFIRTVNTVNPIRLQVNSSTRLEVGNTGVYVPSTQFYVNGGNSANFSGDVNIVDSIVHSGNTTAKIRFPADDTVSFETASTERLRITSDGKVAIGTDAASTLTSSDDLTISTSGSTGITLFSAIGNAGNIAFGDGTSGDDRQRGLLQYHHSDNTMRFFTNAARRMTIASDGKVGIGTDSPLSVLTAYGENRGEGTVTGQITAKDNAAYNASPTAGLVFQGHYASNNAQAIFAGITGFKENANDGNYAGALAFHVRNNGAVAYEALRITSTGKVLIGHDTPTEIGVGAGYQMPLQVIGTSYDTSGMVLARYADNVNGPTLAFVKSRNATKGAQTIVQANDNLGMIRFLGSDGTDTQNAAARIRAFCDTTPASNKIPGRIVFETTSTLTYAQERMRIDSAGRVVIGGEQGNAGASGLYVGGAALAVLGTAYTPNTYACFAMGRIGANVTNNTTIANIRLNGGTLGTGRGAEINAAADANWSDGSSHPTRLTFHTVASSSTSATERLRIQSDGRVNIGVNLSSGAQSLLNLKGNGDDGNQTVLLRLGNDSSGSGTGAAIVMGAGAGASSQGATIAGFYDGTGTAFTVGTNAAFNGSTTERLRIDSSGRIGINNNNPTHPLHILNTSSTFNSASLIKGDNSTSGQGAYVTFTNTADSKSAYFGLDGNGLFAIDPGAALIGTSGTEPIILATNGNTERFRIQASTTATVLVQQASGADVFSVSSDTAETRIQNSLTYVNYGLAIGKQRTQNNTTYGTSAVYTPYYHGEGEKVFGIDPSWSQAELRRFMGSDNYEWVAEEDAPGGYCIKVTNNHSTGGAYNSGFPYIPIDDDDQFFQEMWIRVDAGTSVNHYAGSIQYDKDFSNPTGNPGSFGYELMINHTTNSTTWERRTATLGPNHGSATGHFRSGFTGGKRKYVTPQALFNYQFNSGARVCYISGWAWYRRRSRGNTHFASISKGSGSFQIKHPLEAKKDTHYLRHSFIEGPKCDNIYRGKVTLSSGTATVNLDTAGTMTEGTFVALNENIQCTTTNETGWSAVKGNVSGNILTITAQDNTSTDTISWIVVGERKDDEIKASDLTDASGKLLVEPRTDQQYVGLSTTPMIAPGQST